MRRAARVDSTAKDLTTLARRQHKYRAVPTVVDGIRFASKAEARRYGELKLLEKAGQIRGIVLQPRFALCAPMTTSDEWDFIGSYVADFAYVDDKNKVIYEDVKGMDTPLSKWKRKHVKAQYGIDVQIVK